MISLLFAITVSGSAASVNINDCVKNTDVDQDGLKECVEITLGTDPLHYDTDRDGLPDGYEARQAFDPLTYDSHLDTNCDCKTEYGHYLDGTDPWQRSKHDLNDDFCVNNIDLIIAITNYFAEKKYTSVFIQRLINEARKRRGC